jgi:sec-independent protein translocase protein TatA
MHPLPLASLFGVDPMQWTFIAVVALLIFGGKRLPEMGRSLGKGIVEFKKGLTGIGDELEQAGQKRDSVVMDKPALPSGYKFDPYTGKPIAPAAPEPMRFDPYTGKPLNEQSAGSQPTSSNT